MLGASDEAVTSVLWASRAPAVMASAVAVPAIDSERCDVGGQRLDLVGGVGGGGDQRGLASRAPAVTASAVEVPAIDSERSMSAASVLTWLAASDEAVTSVVWASRAPARIDAAVAVPAAESVRSTSAASDLTWLAASAEADDQRRLRIAGAGQDRVRGAGADGGEGALDFRRGQLQLRADVGGNRKQRLLRGAGAGLDGLAGVDHEIGERAFRILDVGPDAERQLLGARHQAVAGLPSAALDAARHGFDARTQQILELRDARVDVGGDRADPGFDALMDFLEPRRDGVGQLGAAAIDGFGHAGDALVDRFDRLRGAVGQRGGEIGSGANRSSGSPARRRRSATTPACRAGCRWFRSPTWRAYRRLFERFEAAVDRSLVEAI